MEDKNKNFEKLDKKQQLLYSLFLCLEETDQGQVHQETAYAKMFELNPKLYQWETRPEWPDWKRCDSALAPARSKKYGNMWIEPEKGRMLKISTKGMVELEKILKLLPNLDKNIIKKAKEREMKPLTHKILQSILKSDEFITWKSSKSREMAWEDVLDCSQHINVLSTTRKDYVIKILTDLEIQINTNPDYKDCSEFLNQSIQNIKER